MTYSLEQQLINAAAENDLRTVRTLLNRGADANAEIQNGNFRTTLIHQAAEKELAGVLRLLLENGADPDAPDDEGKTALHLLVCHNYGFATESALLTLLEHGADVNAVAEDGSTPLHYAAYYGRPIMTRLLLSRGADVHAVSAWKGMTPLHLLVQNNKGEAAEKVALALLETGADVDAVNEKGRTPLHLAAHHSDSASLLRLLLAHGADANAVDNALCTPLHFAACHGSSVELVQVLIEAGADAYSRTDQGYSALELASACNETAGREDIVHYLSAL